MFQSTNFDTFMFKHILTQCWSATDMEMTFRGQSAKVIKDCMDWWRTFHHN